MENLKPGDKVIFNGTKPFWFISYIENGKLLKIGNTYTIKSIKILSSWMCVILEETGDKEYNLGWFSKGVSRKVC